MKTKADADEFERLFLQLRGLLTDFMELSKKKADDPVNSFKISFVNNLIERANKSLGKRVPIVGFSKFEDSNLPSNSDVVMVLNQYLTLLKKIGAESTYQDPYDTVWHWIIDGKRTSEIAPTSFRN